MSRSRDCNCSSSFTTGAAVTILRRADVAGWGPDRCRCSARRRSDGGTGRQAGRVDWMELEVYRERGITMKRLTSLLVAVATLAGVAAFTTRAPRHAAAQPAAPVFVTEIPSGYRDWRSISV